MSLSSANNPALIPSSLTWTNAKLNPANAHNAARAKPWFPLWHYTHTRLSLCYNCMYTPTLWSKLRRNIPHNQHPDLRTRKKQFTVPYLQITSCEHSACWKDEESSPEVRVICEILILEKFVSRCRHTKWTYSVDYSVNGRTLFFICSFPQMSHKHRLSKFSGLNFQFLAIKM